MSEPLPDHPADPGPRPVPATPPVTDGGLNPPTAADGGPNRRRRGARGAGGRGPVRPPGSGPDTPALAAPAAAASTPAPRPGPGPGAARAPQAGADGDRLPDLPDPPREGRPSTPRRSGGGAGAGGGGGRVGAGGRPPSAPRTTTPKIGDTRPAGDGPEPEGSQRRPPAGTGPGREQPARVAVVAGDGTSAATKRRRKRGGRGRGATGTPSTGGARETEDPVELDEETLERRRGRERKGRPVGRYMMAVHVRPEATQIAVLEGRSLIEHYVSRPTDDASQIHGNIYLGKVQNVLPGMEAAFVDIGTPKNAVLYRGDVHNDHDEVDEKVSGSARIEQILRPGQTVLCQVTKNPIGTKGARLTQEVSLAGRFVVLIPNSSTYGISKRLADDERKRLRRILDDVRPEKHGLIVRTAAEGATPEELRRDVARLQKQWTQIEQLATRSAPALLYREPTLAVRVIREEFNKDYRGVVIDDPELFAEVHDYVAALIPELVDRIELYEEGDVLPLFERQHVHEQLHKALDRKVWLQSGGSLIIERTEALTVIDVNTGKNVGTSNLEETVYRNNLEAAEEIARQLRLRDIGGIIVIDFIDMEIRRNRDDVLRCFKEALARDKTRTQVFDISELGLVEMTRKRVSEGLVEAFSAICPTCAGRGIVLDPTLL